jgi:branched-chain amino acid transport system permease protein
MVVVGGMGSVIGAVAGAFLLVVIPEVLRGFSEYRMLLFGAAMVLVMLVRPQGLFGEERQKASKTTTSSYAPAQEEE